jgi:hypothetical protein
MTDPPASAIKRLVEALNKIESIEIPPRLPAWRGFVREWWECVPEMREASRSQEEFRAALRQKISDIVEDILPQLSLRSGEASRFLSSPFHSTVSDPVTGILYEVGPPDGARRLARPEISGPHGLWEKLTPLRSATRAEELASLTVRYALRGTSARLVRDALTQELEGLASFDLGRYREPEQMRSAPQSEAPEAFAPAREQSHTGAAEPGARMPGLIYGPEADVPREMAPSANTPAEVHASTGPSDLDLLEHIHRHLSTWEEVATELSKVGQETVSRAWLLNWRKAARENKTAAPGVKASTVARRVEHIRRLAKKFTPLSVPQK